MMLGVLSKANKIVKLPFNLQEANRVHQGTFLLETAKCKCIYTAKHILTKTTILFHIKWVG